MQTFDLGAEGLRALNSALHGLKGQTNMTAWDVINPKGAHAIAAGGGCAGGDQRAWLHRLLLRGDEPAGDDPHQGVGRAGRG